MADLNWARVIPTGSDLIARTEYGEYVIAFDCTPTIYVWFAGNEDAMEETFTTEDLDYALHCCQEDYNNLQNGMKIEDRKFENEVSFSPDYPFVTKLYDWNDNK